MRGLYWWYGLWISFAASAFLNLGISVPLEGLDSGFYHSILIKPLFLLPTVGAWFAAHIWLFRSVWMCAGNVDPPVWGTVARWSLALAGPAWLPFILANVFWQTLAILI